jgi:hypothetical protein
VALGWHAGNSPGASIGRAKGDYAPSKTMNDMKQQYSLFVLLVLSVCCLHAQADEGINLEIEGEYQYSAIWPKTGDAIEERRAFSFVSYGFRWMIRTTLLDTKTSNGIEHYEVWFDGKYVYEVTKLREQESTNAPGQERLDPLELESKIPFKRPPRNVKFKNQAVGLAYADMLPDDSPTHAVPFWIAYASTFYFSTNRTGEARQIWPDGKSIEQPSTNLVRASWELTDSEPSFLRKLVYSIPVLTGASSAIKLKDEDANYCPIVRYNVDVFTNVNGTLIPVAFTLFRYRQADIIGGSSSPRVLTKLSATATRISFNRSSSETAAFKDGLKYSTYVTDLRLEPSNHSQPPVYLVTNGVWPSVSNLPSLNMRKPDGTIGFRNSSRQKATARIRNLTRCALGVITLLGVVLTLVTIRKQNEMKKV